MIKKKKANAYDLCATCGRSTWCLSEAKISLLPCHWQ